MYEINTEIALPFEAAKEQIFAVMTENQLTVVSDVDVQATMKKKLDKTILPYHIYGACNAKLADQLISEEPNAGTLLPCTFIIRETTEGNTVVSFMDPETVLTGLAHSDAAKEVGKIAKQKVLAVIEQLQ